MRSAVLRPTLAASAAVFFIMLAAPLQAGPIFFPGEMKDGKFVPAKDAAPGYCVRYSSATVNVEDNKASVQVEDLIDGHEKEFHTVCLIPLSSGTDGSDIRVTLG